MAIHHSGLKEATTPKLQRRLGNSLKNLAFSSNTEGRASRRGVASGVLSASEDNSSESHVVRQAESFDPRKCGGDSVTEIDFAAMKDGALVELVEDSKDPRRTCFAVWKDGEVRFTDRIEQDGQVFVPLSRKDEILRHVRLPSAALPFESSRALLRRLESFISQCVAVDEKQLPVLADFVLSTWFVDRFPVAPYLSVVGLPQSGKTTLLRVLSLVCRRPLLIADITPASFYYACARFMPTMLIDEARSVSCDRILRLLRSGTTRDVLAVRNNRTFYPYGAKVISWLEPPDDPALNSRCVLISMGEGKNTALVSVDEPQVQQS